MFTHSPVKTLTKRWKIILLSGIVVGLIAGVITLFFPLKYRADAQVLIISKSRYGVDPYTVVKSAERVGENIAQVMKTNDFFEKVMEQEGYNIDKSRFQNLAEKEKRQKWGETVSAKVVYGTGVLGISAYSTSKSDALQLAGAMASALVDKGWEYVGGDVGIKIVNDPIVTSYPVKPNVPKNMLVGFLLGMFLSGFVLARKR